jgi:hypothetical protein
MIALWVIPSLFAGSVYINGVRADVPPITTLEGVNVRFDEQGNVWVDAPGYRVQVVSPVAMPEPAPVPRRATDVAAPAARATWWLVTEDVGSVGHSVEVFVNGVLVRRIASGEPQVLVDLSPWLRSGPNVVTLNPLPGAPTAAGSLSVYAGRGATIAGTLHLDNPEVTYTRRAGEPAASRQFTFNLP